MPAHSEGQARVDRIVLAFTGLLTLTMVGMLINSPGLTMVPIPLMVALLTLLATLRPGNHWPARNVLLAQGIFHLCSLAIWLVAWLAVGNNEVTIAGMTTSMGMLVVIGWPFYTITSSLLYAYCSTYSKAIAQVTADAPDRN
ncbi:hypothetical protein EK0264_08565 [Epidermidibacterium keratini]|uniref:Uncharacterized protein n=1 Tax=Epidermidibacterium keratini TaxID=1891644 RepID=A0A7L4YML4_9ACTN|nr:hypothetical protein [Epidermidibacterium keratini]QHC00328.1 hypothetical protein EK0264_08565 [Epidermidibacterium keratini]